VPRGGGGGGGVWWGGGGRGGGGGGLGFRPPAVIEAGKRGAVDPAEAGPALAHAVCAADAVAAAAHGAGSTLARRALPAALAQALAPEAPPSS
jgi:hypothetical protein